MSRQKPVWSPDTPPPFVTSKSQQQPVIVWCKVHRSRNFSPTQGGISEGPSFPCPTTSLPSVRGSYGRRKAISEGSRLDFERCQRQHMTKFVDFQKGLAKPLWDFRTELNIIGYWAYFCRLCFSCCLCFLKCIAPGQLFCQWAKCLYSNRHEKYSMKSSRRNNNIFLLLKVWAIQVTCIRRDKS